MAWTGNTFLVPTYKPYWLDQAGFLLAFSVRSYRIKKREYDYYTTEKIRSADDLQYLLGERSHLQHQIQVLEEDQFEYHNDSIFF